MSLYSRLIDYQKLLAAWNRVRANKPSGGTDQITFEEFEAHKKEFLLELNSELKQGTYRVNPVRLVTIQKEGKEREIALYCLRDKVVQQSLVTELGCIFEPILSPCVFSYRTGKSALHAIEQIQDFIRKKGERVFALKLDIAHFFDRILQEKMLYILKKRIREEDVMELIGQQLHAEALTEDGELKPKTRGIYQGSNLAPLLSNIYLTEFDQQMQQESEFYIRYSDDILVLGSDQAELEAKKGRIAALLEIRGLSLKESKTFLGTVREGFDFLGYHFDEKGKSIPVKAQKKLSERLEETWFGMAGLGEGVDAVRRRLSKLSEVLGGWEQYYREQRKPSSMLEYAALLYMSENKTLKERKELYLMRSVFQNIYHSLTGYLVDLWIRHGMKSLALLEYEQLYQADGLDVGKIKEENGFLEELLGIYRKMYVEEQEEHFTELIQLYSDLKCFGKAAHFLKKKEEFVRRCENPKKPLISIEQEGGKQEENSGQAPWNVERFIVTETLLENYMELFVAREDMYAEEEIQGVGKRRFVQKNEPLTDVLLRRHLHAETTIGTYIQRNNSTVKYLVIDIDVSKNILLQVSYQSELFSSYMQKAANTAQLYLRELKKMGMNGYIEESGYRGYHIWVFFSEWFPVRYVQMFTEILHGQVRTQEEENVISVEFFPNHTRIRAGKPGQVIKLPFGVHAKSGKRTRFLYEDFSPVENVPEFLKDIGKHSLSDLKRVLGRHPEPGTKLKEKELRQIERPKPDYEELGEMAEVVRCVLEKCQLMAYLCRKAQKTGYLSHFERLSVLYVFGHLGEEGKEFVHTIMSLTPNYQYNTTERFIRKLPEKPISCIKLREQYKSITAEYGCSCHFGRNKNCYPSPVLHAIKSVDGDNENVTIPTSRSLSREKEKTVFEEINVHKKAQELAGRILEMKKQKRGIDKNIQKLEHELGTIFDNARTNCMEVEMGLLVRRRAEQGWEWVIEL